MKSGDNVHVFVVICRTVDTKARRRTHEKDHYMEDDARIYAPRRKLQNTMRENRIRKAARSF